MTKKICSIYLSALVLVMTACNSNQAEIDALQCKLDSIQSENEFVKSFVVTIGNCLDSISNEHISSFLVTNGEVPLNDKILLTNKLELLGQCISNQKDKIALLEGELQSRNKEQASKLNKIIISLKKQIAEKDSMINDLKLQLNQKNIDIKTLNVKVGNLKEEVSSLNELTEQQDNALKLQDEMLNEAFVRIATTKELQHDGLLSKGSIFKKKKFDLSAADKLKFDKIDIRTKTSFNIQAKKVKILTPVANDSYSLTKESNGYILTIDNPTKFWSLSNILVIQAD